MVPSSKLRKTMHSWASGAGLWSIYRASFAGKKKNWVPAIGKVPAAGSWAGLGRCYLCAGLGVSPGFDFRQGWVGSGRTCLGGELEVRGTAREQQDQASGVTEGATAL